MRKLTLILSDLYLPDESSAASAFPPAMDLPGLSALLRSASRSATLPDWRRWLSSGLRSGALEPMSIAQIAAHAFVVPGNSVGACLASPVHLSARLDHVRLVDRGLLNLTAEERLAWCSAFDQQFGPAYRLIAGMGRDFLLTGLPASPALTIDPARLLDTDIAPALPRGKDADEMRRLGAEIEMWLHASTLNEARERAGAPRISALWLWGGGLPVYEPAPASPDAKQASIRFHGRDSFLAGLAWFLNLKSPAPAPDGLRALDTQVPQHIVELAPMSGEPREALSRLEENWFVPARAALAAGSLASLSIVANDICFRIAPNSRWRFWRPRRTWLENLALRAQAARA